LRSLGIELPAAEAYDGVELPAPATDRSQL
jgi:hypothetical protein